MTCIVGYTDGDSVVIGGDRAATDGWGEITLLRYTKVFRLGDMLLGVSGSVRGYQLLRYHLEKPTNNRNDPLTFLVKDFIPALRGVFKEHGYTEVDNNRESLDHYALVGYRGQLFVIQSDFSITNTIGAYMAIGSGSPYALGALTALATLRESKKKFLVRTALYAAAEHCNSVSAPFDIEVLDDGLA